MARPEPAQELVAQQARGGKDEVDVGGHFRGQGAQALFLLVTGESEIAGPLA
jgi:hypothetical protein